MQVDGRCHCGRITYAAELIPEAVILCHCTDCQTLSGTAFRSVVLTRRGGFRLLTGALKFYPKRAESGAIRLQGFCPDCGTPIGSTSEGPEPKVYSLRTGSCTQRAQLVPSVEIWQRSMLPWVPPLGAKTCFAEEPPSGAVNIGP